jgi:phosphoribosylaminoimidazolecarboxamide formyltransferase/IMP cyclohydrolase
VVIVKHLNPCGAASHPESIAEAFVEARRCDPVSAFGGIIAVNGPVDEKTARLINEQFAECVIALSYTEAALAVFAEKKNLRVIRIDDSQRFLKPRKEFRQVMDGMLYEDMDVGYSDRSAWTVPTKRYPTEEEWRGLNFAWRLVKYVKSNAIVFTNERASLGIGAGQMSRVDAAEIAVMKAARNQLDLTGSCVASDAFFPFRDGLDVVAKAGATAVIQPGGSVRDEEVIAAADEHGIAMVFTGMRHFRH